MIVLQFGLVAPSGDLRPPAFDVEAFSLPKTPYIPTEEEERLLALRREQWAALARALREVREPLRQIANPKEDSCQQQ